MIFENTEFIDDNLLDLVKRVKQLTKTNPSISWIKDRQIWLLIINDWISTPIGISYDWMGKRQFYCFLYEQTEEASQSIGNYLTPKDAVDSIILLKFMELEIPKHIIAYLAIKAKTCSMQKAVDSIPTETDLEITVKEMRILGINENQRGRIIGKKFGI